MLNMTAVYIMAGSLGLCIGSFLNVVIYRLPAGQSLARPRSRCPLCGGTIRWYDNIPVLSYILLGGKCRRCGGRISFRYMAVELLNAAAWLLCVWRLWESGPYYATAAAFALSALICISFIDMMTLEIPDMLLAVYAALATAAFVTGDAGKWFNHIVSLAVCGGFFAVFYLAGRFISKREVMGKGDIVIAAVSGLMLGLSGALFGLLVASVTASLCIITIKTIRKNGRYTEYPFAPYLAFGTAAALLFAKSVTDYYLKLFD
ncbi:MAG: prepilin peptidase [Eubacteriales bacterium]|nr:prepilin peptidase [Eubacteriales bacterium]